MSIPAIIRRMHFLRVTLYGLAWSLFSVAVRGQPAWCGCVAAWLRGCVVRKRGWLRGPRYISSENLWINNLKLKK
ncbi:uncharacterized protein EV420DRAFT_1549365 [Desarmillaria tabescens]|uniref:Secreted protein n=1 Tax=Armillaria tabescens TaxID=1929756 RepID=A0AA39KA39_ARMTA|nr:uncharacterized protein EV420DRAFT_1549365 [Desarmillaria tabescens]KAK0457197.1 hypothetical protein EV420DRAFT_1549365 [Desarmillaria tabescens]